MARQMEQPTPGRSKQDIDDLVGGEFPDDYDKVHNCWWQDTLKDDLNSDEEAGGGSNCWMVDEDEDGCESAGGGDEQD